MRADDYLKTGGEIKEARTMKRYLVTFCDRSQAVYIVESINDLPELIDMDTTGNVWATFEDVEHIDYMSTVVVGIK